MNWKISWWICVALFSLFIFTDSGGATADGNGSSVRGTVSGASLLSENEIGR